MSNAYLSPLFQDPQFNDDATFLVGGQVWFYEAGTTTPFPAYTDSTASTTWPNPIVLDARGETGGEVWLLAGQPYKIILEAPPFDGQTNGVTISTFDNVTGINDPAAITTTNQNWILFAGTPVYASATSFTISGDQRSIFEVNRRLQSINSGGTIYSTITAVSYTSPSTTVTVVNDSGNLDTGISQVYYGFIQTNPSSIPTGIQNNTPSHNIVMGWSSPKLTVQVDSTGYGANWPINVTGSLLAPDGSVTAPSIGFATDGSTDTGFYHPADGSIYVACNGVNTAQFTSSGITLASGSFTGNVTGNVSGNAGTVTNGVYNDGGTYGISVTGYSTSLNTGSATYLSWDGTSATTGGNPFICGNFSTNSAQIYFTGIGSASLVHTLQIDNSGLVTKSTSSLKYKKDITPLSHGLEDVLKLRPITYVQKDSTDNKIVGGLIAEEVDEIGLREFVVYADDGKPDALGYANMVALAFKAIQELNVKIEDLKSEVATLKGSV